MICRISQEIPASARVPEGKEETFLVRPITGGHRPVKPADRFSDAEGSEGRFTVWIATRSQRNGLLALELI